MNITRQPVLVEQFHYEHISKDGLGERETSIVVGVHPLDMSEVEDFPKDSASVLGLSIDFMILFQEFHLSGVVRQLVTIDRVVESPNEFTKKELDMLLKPLFSVIERISYEVTEIALDQPGVQLNFQQEEESEEA